MFFISENIEVVSIYHFRLMQAAYLPVINIPVTFKILLWYLSTGVYEQQCSSTLNLCLLKGTREWLCGQRLGGGGALQVRSLLDVFLPAQRGTPQLVRLQIISPWGSGVCWTEAIVHTELIWGGSHWGWITLGSVIVWLLVLQYGI